MEWIRGNQPGQEYRWGGRQTVGDMVSDRTLSLPLSAGMSDDEAALAVGSLQPALRRGR